MTASSTKTSLDSSRRFILGEDSPYLRNLAALWCIDPQLARRIESLDGDGYPIEQSRSGDPTVAVNTTDSRKIYLHSRHQPLDEARRSIEPLKFDSAYIFSIHGLGLGYALNLAFERASKDCPFVIFEPDLKMIQTAFWNRDFSEAIESRRVFFYDALDKAEVFGRLFPYMPLVSTGVQIVTLPPSAQIHPEFHEQARALVDDFVAYARTSVTTLVMNGQRTSENIARNLGWYSSTPSVARLKNRHRGQPAIIVSAGPSLRKNKHLLKDAQGKAVMIAVQTTLKPLLEIGIEPQYVTSIDYHEICTRFFENLPPTLKTELVAEPKASGAVFGMHPGPVSILGNNFAEGLLREMKLGKGRLPAGATVAHLAYYLAEHLGCDPIIFVGQDLGFSDGLCYMPGTSYEDVWRPELTRFCTLEMKQWDQIVRDRPILRKIPDHQGNPMYTEERLYTYLQQFERDFANTGTQIIDASEGGAMKRGATPMKLAEAIAQYCREPIAIGDADSAQMHWDRLGECLCSIEARADEGRRIEEISRKTLPLLEEVRDCLDDQPRVNRLIARIDALRAQMNELGSAYELIMQLTQLSELQRFKGDAAITASKESEQERQRMQVKRDVENVRAVAEAAGQFVSLMNEVADRLRVDMQGREVAAA